MRFKQVIKLVLVGFLSAAFVGGIALGITLIQEGRDADRTVQAERVVRGACGDDTARKFMAMHEDSYSLFRLNKAHSLAEKCLAAR